MSKRLRDLQRKVASIAEEPPDYFIPERHQTALKGFLKTYIVKGRSGYDPSSFLKKARSQFYVLMRKQRKPLKSKCIFTCGFIRRDSQNNLVIERSEGHFHSQMETVTASTNTFTMFDRIQLD